MALPGKRDFADVVKLRLSRWGDFPGLLRWDNVITRVLMRVEAGGSESEKEI